MVDLPSANPVDDSTPQQGDDGDTFVRLRRWWDDDSKHSGDWRKGAENDYKFAALDQWDDADKERLKEQIRPIITMDRTAPFLDNVSGMEVNNRQEVRYIPRTEGDEQVNEVLTGAAEFFRDQCDAEDEESDAFYDLCVCGMGWTETHMAYDQEPDGKLLVDRIDPLEMGWDCSSRKRNLDDARRVWRVKEIDRDEAEQMFPDADAGDLDAAWAIGMPAKAPQPYLRSPGRQYESGGGATENERGKDRVRIVECQWWEREVAGYRVVDPATRQEIMLSPEQHKTMAAGAKQAGTMLDAAKVERRVYKRAFLGAVLLEEGPGPVPDNFTYRCMTGKRDRNAGTWFGLMRQMKDPQKWANTFFSSILHSIQTSGKGIMAELDAFDNKTKAEEDWASPDAIVWVKPEAIQKQKIMPKPGSVLPPGLPEMLQFAISAIPSSTGINLEAMGLADRQQAGVLEYQRKQSAMTILAPLFDALRRYRKEQGRVMLQFIRQLPPGRLVRIVGDDKAKYVPLTQDQQTLIYDVIVDDAPTSPNQKEATWQILQNLMPMLLKLPLPPAFWALVAKQSPLPTSFADKLQGIIEEQASQPPPPDPAMVKLEADKAAAAQQMQLDQQSHQAGLVRDQQKAANDLQIRQEQAKADITIEGWKATQQAALQRDKMVGDQAMQRDKMTADSQLQERQAQANGQANGKGHQQIVLGATGELKDLAAMADQVAQQGEQIAKLADGMQKVIMQTVEQMRGEMQQIAAEVAAEAARGRPQKWKLVRGADGRVAGAEAA